MARSEELDVTLRVAAIFDALGVPYLVGGSVASSLLGIPRATLDVDLVADLRDAQVQALVDALGDDFYADVDAIRDATRRRASFNVVFLPYMLKVDVFVLKSDPLSQCEMARRFALALPGDPPASLQVGSAEDIVLQKLHWYRLGSGISERQWRDVLGVIKVQAGRLDDHYLDLWAPSLGVTDLLHKARAEAKV